MTDFYPLQFQFDIINVLHGMRNTNVMDGFVFFQFPIKHTNWYKFIFISYRGLKYFQITAMGFKNSPPFIQKIMDKMLKPLKDFAKIYIDDIVSFSKDYETHIYHFRQFFGILTNLNVILSIKKRT